MAFCPECGGKGTRPDGTVCSCKLDSDAIFAEIRGVEVPEQYQGLFFDAALVPSDLSPAYAPTLDKLHREITTQSMRHHNVVVCSPPQHSKSVWAYSCIQNLWRQRAPVMPIKDLLEIGRMMHEFSDTDDWYEVPYLFLKIPTEVTQSIRATMVTVLDRRVRRGGSTIFIYNGSWGMLTYDDKFSTTKSLQGDGSFHSLDVVSFRKKEEPQ